MSAGRARPSPSRSLSVKFAAAAIAVFLEKKNREAHEGILENVSLDL